MTDRPQHRDGPPVALTDDAIFDALIEHSKDNAAATGAAKQAIQRITILRHAQTDTNEAASARIKELDDRGQALHALIVRLVDVLIVADEPRLREARAFDDAQELLKGEES